MKYVIAIIATLLLASCANDSILSQLAVESGENAIVRVCGDVSTSAIPWVGGSAQISYVEIPDNVDLSGITAEDLEDILDCD